MPLDREFLESEMKKIIDLLLIKNKDYGNAFFKSMDEFGSLSFVIRLQDKIERVKSLIKSDTVLVKDESFFDTINDIIGYCLLYKHYLKKYFFKNA